MQHGNLVQVIEAAFADRERIGFDTKGEVREAVEAALDLLDRGGHAVDVAPEVDLVGRPRVGLQEHAVCSDDVAAPLEEAVRQKRGGSWHGQAARLW